MVPGAKADQTQGTWEEIWAANRIFTITDPAMAERMVHQYMENHSPGSYEMGEFRDEGSYYMTDIVRPENGAKERLRIDKRTGNIRPIR